VRPLRRALALNAALGTALIVNAAPAAADTVTARCDITMQRGALTRTLPCSFSQRQGVVGIELPDGQRLDLSPLDGPRYRDADGRMVKQRLLGRRGQAYDLPDATWTVTWDRSGLPGEPFDRKLALRGIAFHVESANDTPRGRVRITPEGLLADNTPVERPIEGHVGDAFAADLDRDGSPEIYVVVRHGGSADGATLVALSANRRKSLSDIALPDLSEHASAARGYRGHDQFTLRADGLWRRFPVYAPGDADDRPSQGSRELRYRLVPGEASWRLRVDRVVQRPGRAAH
jgi:hypothetical protein